MDLLFIFAHPDDESFSTGGTIAKYVDNGHNVYTVCLTSTKERREEYYKATDVLGVKRRFIFNYKHIDLDTVDIRELLIELLIELRPDIVVTHLENDYHRDHSLTYFIVRDAIGRKWQLGTIQVDYNLPERFDLTYIGADNEKHRPVMIHRAPFGSMERFVAVLIEHCGGNFPLWLNPNQVIILPISEKYNDYGKNVLNLLDENDIRGVIDTRSEKTGRKIRDAELKKIPFMFIVGEKEENDGTVSVRKHGEGDIGTYSIEQISNIINSEVEELMNLK